MIQLFHPDVTSAIPINNPSINETHLHGRAPSPNRRTSSENEPSPLVAPADLHKNAMLPPSSRQQARKRHRHHDITSAPAQPASMHLPGKRPRTGPRLSFQWARQEPQLGRCVFGASSYGGDT